MPERTQRLAHMALVVREYDEAIEFYVDKLGFELLEDTDLGGEKRWVRVAPPGGGGAALLLARASGQNSRAGSGTRPAGGSSCSSKRITFSAITRPILRRASGLGANQRKNRTGRLRCSKTFTAISGT